MFGNNNPPIQIGVPVSRLFRSNLASSVVGGRSKGVFNKREANEIIQLLNKHY